MNNIGAVKAICKTCTESCANRFRGCEKTENWIKERLAEKETHELADEIIRLTNLLNKVCECNHEQAVKMARAKEALR